MKDRGEQCKSGLYLHYPADRDGVVRYCSDLAHNFHEITSNGRPKITNEIKNLIQLLFDNDLRIRSKPKSVLDTLGKKKECNFRKKIGK